MLPREMERHQELLKLAKEAEQSLKKVMDGLPRWQKEYKDPDCYVDADCSNRLVCNQCGKTRSIDMLTAGTILAVWQGMAFHVAL